MSETSRFGAVHGTLRPTPFQDLMDTPHGTDPHEWQRAHDKLLQKERQLAQATVRHTRREMSNDDLDALKSEVTVLRKRHDALFDAAFSRLAMSTTSVT
jgi:hypothetical protein